MFVPSIAGKSHCEDEATDFDDVERGANVLLHAALRRPAPCEAADRRAWLSHARRVPRPAAANALAASDSAAIDTAKAAR